MILAANLKTNHTRQSVRHWLGDVESFMGREEITDTVAVFPPATALTAWCGKVAVGAQNAYPVANGSFTGEIGLDQLDEFGCKTILIGHSERRHVLGESNGLIRRKYDFFKEKGFTVYFCIGEPLAVKEQGFDAVMDYVKEQLVGIDTGYANLILAYEPVWAIGTGLTAEPSDIEKVHGAIKALCDKPLLYGGSVKPANAGAILKTPGVDGLLIGTASWKSNMFCDILSTAKSL